MNLQSFVDSWPGADASEVEAVLWASSGKGRTHDDVITRRWYESLDRGVPAFDIYDDPAYAPYVWAAWKLQSSYRVNRLRRLHELGQFRDVGSVVDLGCGVGYSTLALAAIWNVKPVGTNLEGVQAQIARSLGVTVVPEPVPADLVLASEYFEHFEHPVEHLEQVLTLAGPRYLITGNAFGARSPGHFGLYGLNGRSVSGHVIAVAFGRFLRDRGWVRRRHPVVWNTGVWVRGQ